jgi:hypothetical protein
MTEERESLNILCSQIVIRLLTHFSIFSDLVEIAMRTPLGMSKVARNLINVCLSDPTTVIRPGVIVAAPRLQSLLQDYAGKLARSRSNMIALVSGSDTTACIRRFLRLLRRVPDESSGRAPIKLELVWQLLALVEVLCSKVHERNDGKVELLGQFEQVAAETGHQHGLVITLATLVKRSAHILEILGGQVEPTASFDGIEGTQKIKSVVLRRMVDSADQVEGVTNVLLLGCRTLSLLLDLVEPAVVSADAELAQPASGTHQMRCKHSVLVLTRATLSWYLSTCAIEQRHPSNVVVASLARRIRQTAPLLYRVITSDTSKHPKGGDSISTVLVEIMGFATRFPEHHPTILGLIVDILRLVVDIVNASAHSRPTNHRWCRQLVLILPQLFDFSVLNAKFDAVGYSRSLLFELLERIDNLDPDQTYGIVRGLVTAAQHQLDRALDEADPFIKGSLGFSWHLEWPIDLLRLICQLGGAGRFFSGVHELEDVRDGTVLPDVLTRLSQRDTIPSSTKQAVHLLAVGIVESYQRSAREVPAGLEELVKGIPIVTDEEEAKETVFDLRRFAEAIHPSFLSAEPASPFRPATTALSKVYTGDEFRSSRMQLGPNINRVNRPNTSRPPSLHVRNSS